MIKILFVFFSFFGSNVFAVQGTSVSCDNVVGFTVTGQFLWTDGAEPTWFAAVAPIVTAAGLTPSLTIRAAQESALALLPITISQSYPDNSYGDTNILKTWDRIVYIDPYFNLVPSEVEYTESGSLYSAYLGSSYSYTHPIPYELLWINSTPVNVGGNCVCTSPKVDSLDHQSCIIPAVVTPNLPPGVPPDELGEGSASCPAGDDQVTAPADADLLSINGYDTSSWSGDSLSDVSTSYSFYGNQSGMDGGSGDSSGYDIFAGDPINTAIGNVVESARDYRGSGPFPVNFSRTYNSLPSLVPGFVNSLGGNWRGTYDANIVTHEGDVYVYRPDGKAVKFTLVNGAYASASDVVATLTTVQASGKPAGWIYTTAVHTVETYDVNGHLKSIANRNGLVQTLAYDGNGSLTSVTDPFRRVLNFTYDASKRLVTLTGPDLATIRYAYDANNNLTSVTYPDSTTTGYQYQNSAFPSLLTGRIDAKGVVVSTWTYDNQGRAIGNQLANGVAAVTVMYNQDSTDVIDVRGVTRTRQFKRIGSTQKLVSMTVACRDCDAGLLRTVSHDSNGFATGNTDFSGFMAQNTRDSRGLALTETVAAGTPLARTIKYTWHPIFPNLTSIVLPNNQSSQFEYDDKGNLTKRTMTADGVSRVSTYQYNAAGQLIHVTNPGADGKNVTTLTYDKQGNLASVTNALNQSIHFTQYDANGRLLSLTDPRGRSTTFTYDANGRRTSITTGALVSKFTYNANGQRASVSLADGSILDYAYDDAHRLTDVIDTRDTNLHLTRDAAGNVTQRTMTVASGAVVRSRAFAYDQRGRLLQVTGNSGQKTVYTYDRTGHLLSVSDALSRTNQTQYDELQRLIQSIDAKGNITAYDYDVNDNLVGVTSPRGVATQYQRNGFGQVIKLISPDTGQTSYQYDTAGKLIAATDARGKSARMRYDVLGRPTQINLAEDQQVSLTYDQGHYGIGRLTAVNNPTSGNSYQYDVNGRVALQRQTIGNVSEEVKYDHTEIGQLTSMHYPSGMAIQYAYAADGKTVSLNLNGTSLLGQIKYQADGQIGQWTWGNTRVTSRSFDIDGRLTAFSKAGSSATIAYDNADRIVNMADSSGPSRTQGFAYDNNDALTNYTANATTQRYQYDEDGNRTAQGNGGAIANYAYASGSNRLLKLTGSQKATLQYDAAGNIVADGANRYTYDTLGRLVQVSNVAGSTRYLFDPLGQRVAKLNGRGKDGEDDGGDNEDSKTATTYFTYDTVGHLIGEYNRQRSQSTEYVWLDNAPVAVLKKNGNAPAQLYYVHTDHLGTPRQVTNSATNAVVWEWFGEPFGTSVPDEDPGHTGKKFTLNLRYAGQYYDKESSLFHNGFRDYNPKIGRYVQSDPIGLKGGINTYTYVGGNPLSRVDPMGLDWFRPADHSYVVGRKDSIVEPGKGLGKFIDDNVPAGHTFGSLHDAGVNAYLNEGYPDWLVNIPTMPSYYWEALVNETADSIMKLLGKKPGSDSCSK